MHKNNACGEVSIPHVAILSFPHKFVLYAWRFPIKMRLYVLVCVSFWTGC